LSDAIMTNQSPEPTTALGPGIRDVELTSVTCHHPGLRIEVSSSARVILVAGPNGSGKTSVANAIRIALTGSPDRGLSRKNELSQLITRGERDGYAAVRLAGASGPYKIHLRTGNYTTSSPTGFPADILNPAHWLAQSPKERLRSLFALTGTSLKPAHIAGILVSKYGHDASRVESITGDLSAGLPAAADKARTLASEARGAWKAITGENYGSVKAERWMAPAPPQDDAGETPDLPAAEAALKQARDRHMAARENAATLRALRINAEKWAAEMAGAKLSADTAKDALPEVEARIASLQNDVQRLKAVASKAGGTTAECPSCGTMLNIYSGQLEVYEGGGDTNQLKAHEKLKEYEQLLGEQRHTRERLIASINRYAQLEAMRPADVPSQDEAEAAAADLDALREAEEAARAIVSRCEHAEQARRKADEATEGAARAHADVQCYTALASDLDALPGALLGAAIGPFRDALAAASSAFARPVTITDAGVVQYGDSSYDIASSASEQWRCRMAVGYALARATGTGLLLLDEFDVIQPADRGPILAALAGLDGVQTWLFATLKEPPKLPSPFFTVWLGS
jgi:uncharacterized small protein (DUF1192 family)